HSLLKLTKDNRGYGVAIHEEFRVPEPGIPERLDGPSQVEQFIRAIPHIKYRIALYRERRNREIEFEQLLIRANNCEHESNSDFFIVDRQVSMPGDVGQLDLLAIYWKAEHRKRNQVVPLELIEVKFGLNNDIYKVCDQLRRYYCYVRGNIEEAAEGAERLLKQKIDLGLFDQPQNRLDAMRTLKISRRVEDLRCGVVLVDYNPNSTLLDGNKWVIEAMPQPVDVFRAGLGLWVCGCSAQTPLPNTTV
ncbi:MAG TPA: hypothetical protein VHS28_00385, partial [Chloroflexota bacterium]|nr:hypothetical protein [Chloroflexota bacterium]